jgi:transposase
MNYIGIDIHKKYSVACVQDEAGKVIKRVRIENSAEGFRRCLNGDGEPARAVIEACWNWGKVYDTLEGIEGIEEIVLAHPLKTRLIADAQIKTDKIDAAALATLLRGNLVARAHVPGKATRLRKDQLRQRLYWARLRTRIRNRLHALLDRQDDPCLPQCSDLFGSRGTSFLKKLRLTRPEDQRLLDEDLALLDLLASQIKAQEARIKAANIADADTALIASIPGMGPILSAVVAAEIDGIERFGSAARLCAYAGLVPSTYASGGVVYNGKLLNAANKWLRWALIEATWVAVGCSGYFGSLYRHHRARGKKANTSITIVARRMSTILWHLLKERRSFEEDFSLSPVAPCTD